MEMINRFFPIAFLLMVVGGLTWGIFGLTGTNLLAEIFGTGTLADVVYVVVGLAALMSLPKLFESFSEGMSHEAHPRGT